MALSYLMVMLMCLSLLEKHQANGIKCVFSSNLDNCDRKEYKEANEANCPGLQEFMDQTKYAADRYVAYVKNAIDDAQYERSAASRFGYDYDDYEDQQEKLFACTSTAVVITIGNNGGGSLTKGLLVRGCAYREFPRKYVANREPVHSQGFINLQGKKIGVVVYCFGNECNDKYPETNDIPADTAKRAYNYCHSTQRDGDYNTDRDGGYNSNRDGGYNRHRNRDGYYSRGNNGKPPPFLLIALVAVFTSAYLAYEI